MLHRLILPLFFACLSGTAAYTQTVEVPAKLPTVAPGESAILRAVLVQPRGEADTYALAYERPEFVRLIAPRAEIDVAAGDQRAVVLPIDVSINAPPGPAAVAVTATSGASAPMRFAVPFIVMERIAGSIEVITTPRNAVRGPYELVARVVNEGNVRAQFALGGSAVLEIGRTVEPSVLELGPGEDGQVTVRVAPELPEDTIRTDRTWLVLRDATSGRRLDATRVPVDVLPSFGRRGRAGPFHTIPLTVRTAVRTGIETAEGTWVVTGSGTPTLTTQIAGALLDSGQPRVHLSLRTPIRRDRAPRFQARYQGVVDIAMQLPGATRIAPRTTPISGLGGRVDIPIRQNVHRANRLSVSLHQNADGAHGGVGVRLRDEWASTSWATHVGTTVHPSHRSFGGTFGLSISSRSDVLISGSFGRRFGPILPRAQGTVSFSVDGVSGSLQARRVWSIDDDDDGDGFARVRRQSYEYRPPTRRYEGRWLSGRVSGSVAYEHTVRKRADEPVSAAESWDGDLDVSGEAWTLRTDARRSTRLPLDATQAVRHADAYRARVRLSRVWGIVDVGAIHSRTLEAGVVTKRSADVSTGVRNVEMGDFSTALSAKYRTNLPVDACRPNCDPGRKVRIEGSVQAYGGTARFSLEPIGHTGLSLDVGYGYATTVRPFGLIPIDVSIAGGDRWLDTVSADVRGTFGSRFGRLDLSGGVRHERNGTSSTTFTARAGWSYRIDVPVSYRSDLGRLEGRVLGPDGSPFPGAVVRVDEREFVTDEEGRFTSDVLPVGPATVFVDTTRVPSGMLVAPNPVQDVVLESGEAVEVTFQLVEATGVRGRIAYEEPPTDVGDDVVFGTGRRDVDPLVVGERTIVVRNDERSYRTKSNPDGTFELDRMYPGTYRVEVVEDPALEFFRIEPAVVTVDVEGPEPASVDLRIVPERRTVEVEERPGLSFP